MRFISVILSSLLLGACAQPKVVKQIDTEFYLRADFTYWEANPAFAFKVNEQAGVRYVKTRIIYDGNPYQFIIADKAWTADKNCGYAEVSSRVLTYNNWLELDCSYDADKNAITPIQRPFEFTPIGTGDYLFELKTNEQGTPTHLRVSAIKSKKQAKPSHSF